MDAVSGREFKFTDRGLSGRLAAVIGPGRRVLVEREEVGWRCMEQPPALVGRGLLGWRWFRGWSATRRRRPGRT
jgi:hypothetical protein